MLVTLLSGLPQAFCGINWSPEPNEAKMKVLHNSPRLHGLQGSPVVLSQSRSSNLPHTADDFSARCLEDLYPSGFGKTPARLRVTGSNISPDGSVPQNMDGRSLILAETLPFTLFYLLFALVPLYIALYCVVSRASFQCTFLSTSVAVIAFASCPYAASTQCSQADIILRLACGTAIMKALDMFFRRPQPPKLNWNATPAVYAFYLLIELRYESFDISTARKSSINLSDDTDYGIHLAAFLLLQCFPQSPVPKAFGVLLAIWLIWNSMHYVLKYRNSPPLFGPIYRAENLSYFWTQTWHNAYTSPTRTLGYRPMRMVFGPIGGVMGGFGLMAIFHVWALAPYVEPDGLFRVAVFFLANGAGSIADYWVWEKRNTWMRVLVNWGFEVYLAQYTVAKFGIPDGLLAIDYRNICRGQI